MLFGGVEDDTLAPLNDTWAYDYNDNTWAERSPRPSRATSHGMAYDAQSDRVVVFGGQEDQFMTLDETWVYDYNNDTWTNANPSTGPPATFHPAMVYDADSDRVVLWSGSTGSDFVGVWAYDVDSNAWVNLEAEGEPTGRLLHRMAYDAGSDRSILFGGRVGAFELVNDTWSYDLNGNEWTPLIVPPSKPEGLKATAGDAEVNLSWEPPSFLGSHPIANYLIYRGVGEGLSLLQVVGSTETYVDQEVQPGTTYYYRVAAWNAAGESAQSRLSLAAPFDLTNPTVAITSPTDGSTLTNATVAVAGTASDNVAVEKVEVRLEGGEWAVATGTTDWSAHLTLVEGSNTIYARAVDASGNTANASVTVSVSSPPPPPPPSPPWLWFLGLAAAASLAIVVAVVLVRRRRSR